MIAALEDEDGDDEPSEVTLVTGGQRVRVRAPQGSRPEIELSPMSTPPAKKVTSEPPASSLPTPAKGAAHVLQNVKSWQHVAALAIIAAFLAFAISKGLALW
jgi:hypothetical protein